MLKAHLRIAIQSLVAVVITLSVHDFLLADINNYDNIKKYTKCAALQNVVANILSETEQEFYQHELHHAAQGSMVVAMEFVKTSEYSKNTVDELYSVYLDEYRALLKEEERGASVAAFVESLRPQIDRCRYLNELQSDIIRRHKKVR